jgi:hypothetical protein
LQRIVAYNDRYLLGCRDNFDHASVIGEQLVAPAENVTTL